MCEVLFIRFIWSAHFLKCPYIPFLLLPLQVAFGANARTFAAVSQMKQSEEGPMPRAGVTTPGPRDQRPELSAFVDLLPFLQGLAEGPPGLF